MTSKGYPPQLTLLEKLDMIPAQMSVVAAAVFAAVTGVFRGSSGAKTYSKHIMYAAVRRMLGRLSTRQNQASNPTTRASYESLAKQKSFEAQTVELADGALGHWIGKKDAKNVLVYYHGGGFAVAANISYFQVFSGILDELNAAGKDISIFWISYSLTPHAVYPTQVKQAVSALRYILKDLHRSPSNVFIGGDSAGGNLTLAVLSHLSHPHPEIEALEIAEPLAGALTIAPWVSFSTDYASMKGNAYKDMLTPDTLKRWSDDYLAGAKGDYYNQAALAPSEWWNNMKTKHILVVVGSDDVLLGGIQEFVEKLKAGFPNTTYVVGPDEPHVAPIVYQMAGDTQVTAQGKELRSWLSSRL